MLVDYQCSVEANWREDEGIVRSEKARGAGSAIVAKAENGSGVVY